MLKNASILLILCVGALIALGLTMLASTGAWVTGLEEQYLFLRKQSQMLLIGVVLALAAALVSPELLRRFYPLILAAACVALALCFVKGVGVELHGSKRWVEIPFVGQVQPSEFAKVAVMIALAGWFARWQTEVRTFWRGFVLPGAMAGVPVLLIMAETDVGTALSVGAAAGAVLFCVGTRLVYLVPTVVAGVAAAGIFVYFNENRWARVQAWLDLENPELVTGTNMQQVRALYALGNGGPTGVGLGNGVEKFSTLHLAHSDFILPAIGEELGLIATLGIIICYVMIAVCGVGIAMQSNQVFGRCLALGLTCVLVVPSMMHVGVTTGVLPNDGVALPFVSYGGTNLIFSLVAVGLLVGIQRRNRSLAEVEFPLTRERRLAVRL